MRKAALAYVLLIHALLALALVKTDIVPRALVALGLKQPANWQLEWMRGSHVSMDASVPAGATIFLGDSLTQGLAVAAVAPIAVNYGIGGQTSWQLIDSMALYGSMGRAARVVITIGTNDLLQGREAGIGARYRAILARVPAAIPVTLNGIPEIRGHDVRQVVEAARLACLADHRCTFVDAQLGEGALRPDGVHLTTAGYGRWIELLRARSGSRTESARLAGQPRTPPAPAW